jgi:hypothetical protein
MSGTGGLVKDEAEPGQREVGRWSLAVGVAAIGGVAVALAVVRLGARQSEASVAYVDRPEFAVFGGLVLLQVPVWAVLGVVSARWASQIRRLPPDRDRPYWQVMLAWLGAALAIGALLAAQGAATAGGLDPRRQYPDDQSLRIVAMASVVAFAAAVPTVALWGLSRAADAIEPDAPDAMARFRWLWGRQRNLLGALSLMLVLVMLSTAAKFQANNTFTPPDGEPLPEAPATLVLVIGALYGSVLLGAYLPPHYRTRAAGERLATSLAGPSAGSSGADQLAALDRRQRFRVALGVDEDTRQHLERNAVLLAPLLTALVATMLPGVDP